MRPEVKKKRAAASENTCVDTVQCGPRGRLVAGLGYSDKKGHELRRGERSWTASRALPTSDAADMVIHSQR